MFAAPIRSSAPLFATISAALVLAASAAPCIAADASSWDGDSRTAVRLINARHQNPGAPLRAGVEIRLATGWKTYWRYPGDSGVPPRFDFSGSKNVKSVEVAWPAPQRFSDVEGNTIGYKTSVTFPLRIEPRERGKPVALKLKLEYAVCEKLCVPVDAKGELAIEQGSETTEAAIGDAERRTPKAIPLNAPGTLAIRNVAQEAGSPRRVVVDVAAPLGAAVMLFAEGPAADWALPLPEPGSGAPAGLQRFTFALDGLPPGTRPDGAALRLTAVTAEDAIETTIRLD